MKDYWITFRSVTYAQRGERVLQQNDIDCLLRRTPRELSGRGCGYCLRLDGTKALAAVTLLRAHGILFEKIYAETSGRMEAREL